MKHKEAVFKTESQIFQGLNPSKHGICLEQPCYKITVTLIKYSLGFVKLRKQWLWGTQKTILFLKSKVFSSLLQSASIHPVRVYAAQTVG